MHTYILSNTHYAGTSPCHAHVGAWPANPAGYDYLNVASSSTYVPEGGQLILPVCIYICCVCVCVCVGVGSRNYCLYMYVCVCVCVCCGM